MYRIAIICLFGLIGGCASTPPVNIAALEEEVAAVEAAFAQTMADRDFAAFTSFLAEDTLFFAGETPQRGRQVVADAWKPFFEGDDAPFSWRPVTVAVREAGDLALSSGPVFTPDGRQVGVYNSIWRRKADGSWEIIFDKGGQYCPRKSS